MLKTEEGKIVYRYGGETVWLEAFGQNGVRVRSTQNAAFDTRHWALDPKDAHPGKTELFCAESDAAKSYGDTDPVQVARLTNGSIAASMDANGVICFTGKNGKPLLKECARRLCDEVGMALGIGPRVYKGEQSNLFRTEVRFCANADEKIFGMGQYQQHELDLKGCVLELAQRNSQVSVPFYLSSLGYGFLWNNPAIGEVAFGKNYTQWVAQKTGQIDYLVIAGDTPAEIHREYMQLTGLPPMMPEYGLGFWQCKLRYASQQELLGVARRYRQLGIPLDVIVCDFFHWTCEGDFQFDPAYWPDPEGMCRELAEMGIRLMVSVWPTVSIHSKNYLQMAENGLLTRTERGVADMMNMPDKVSFFDATNPEARQFVWQQIKQNYWDKGARLYWLDVAEPEYGSYDFDLYRYQLGPSMEVGNSYPRFYLKVFYEGMTAAGEPAPLLLSRSAWAGSAKYGALVWSGDIISSFECFDRQVKAGINMGIAGIPWWTTDIGGFHGGKGENPLFRELFCRWFAWACFCPVMRLHGNRQGGHDVPGTIYGSGGDNEIYSFGEEVFAICKKYIALRESLRPYLRKVMEKAHTDGSPIMQPLFYAYPKDTVCWSVEDEYLFGPEYLVAPVTVQGAASRKVYLPKGEWQCIHTGTRYPGGQWIELPAPIDVIPVLKKI